MGYALYLLQPYTVTAYSSGSARNVDPAGPGTQRRIGWRAEMEHKGFRDAKSLLTAATGAMLACAAAIAGSTRAGASVDENAVVRQLVAPAASAVSNAAGLTTVRRIATLDLAPLDAAEAAVRAQVEAGALPGA